MSRDRSRLRIWDGPGSRPGRRRGPLIGLHEATRYAMQQSSEVQALGYVGVRAKTLEDWADFGSGFLGMQRIDKSRSTLAFRMDDRKQRLLVAADGGEGISCMGWELAD